MSTGKDKSAHETADFLAEEEARIAALYRKLAQTEPDARLDAAVRAMAHHALDQQLVATPRGAATRRRRLRWVPALGAAAGVVLAAGIAFRLGPSLHDDRESGQPANEVISVRPLDAPAPPLEAPPPSPPRPSTEETAPSVTGDAARLQSRPAALPEERERLAAPAATPAAPAASTDPGKVEKSRAAPSQPQPFPAATPAPGKRNGVSADAVERRETMAEGAWQDLQDRDPHERTQAAGARTADHAVQPATPPAAHPDRNEPLAKPLAAPPAAERARPAPEPERQLRLDAAPARNAGSAAQSPPPRPASAPEAATASPTMQRPPAPPAQAAADAGPPSPASESKQRHQPASTDPNAQLYPEHWLANIRTMLREDRREDALRSFSEFRRMYPDYRLPDDLRELQ